MNRWVLLVYCIAYKYISFVLFICFHNIKIKWLLLFFFYFCLLNVQFLGICKIQRLRSANVLLYALCFMYVYSIVFHFERFIPDKNFYTDATDWRRFGRFPLLDIPLILIFFSCYSYVYVNNACVLCVNMRKK